MSLEINCQLLDNVITASK